MMRPTYASVLRAGSVALVFLAVVLTVPPTSPARWHQLPRAVAAVPYVPATTIPSEALPRPADPIPPVDPPGDLVAGLAAPAAAPVEPTNRTVMLIGDSMAYTAALGLAPQADAWHFTVVNEGIMGCGVVRGGPFRYFGAQRDFEARCETWPAAWEAAISRAAPDLVAIFVGRWELMDRMHDGVWTNLFDPAFADYIRSELDTAIALPMAHGCRVVVFTAPYYRRGLTKSGGLFPEDEPARVDAINVILRGAAEARGVPVVDVGAQLSPGGGYTREIGGVNVRSDGVHLTRRAGELLAPWLFPQLQIILSTPPPPST
jgi:hypothetical protein